MIPQALLVTAIKGGSGKTTISLALAGFASKAGWRVLLVDTDSQGNITLELGLGDDEHDQGESFAQAVSAGSELNILKEVRPNIDVIACGHHARQLRLGLQEHGMHRFEEVLTAVAGDYDLIIIDSKPDDTSEILLAAIDAAHFAVIPTTPDYAGFKSMADVAALMEERTLHGGSQIITLGVVAFNFFPAHQAYNAKRLRKLDQLQSILPANVPLLEPCVTSYQIAATDMRDRGMLLTEYVDEEKKYRAAWRARLRQGRDPDEESMSSQAPKLAAELNKLSSSILTRYIELVQTADAASDGGGE